MKKKALLTSSFTILLAFAIACAYAGQLTLTTILPPPYAHHTQVTVSNNPDANITIDSNGDADMAASGLNFKTGGKCMWNLPISTAALNQVFWYSMGAPQNYAIGPYRALECDLVNRRVTFGQLGVVPDPSYAMDVVGPIRFGYYNNGASDHSGVGKLDSTFTGLLFADRPSIRGIALYINAVNDAGSAYASPQYNAISIGEPWTSSTPPAIHHGRVSLTSAWVCVNSALSSFTFNGNTVQVVPSSDIRLKKDIAAIPGALDRICLLRGVNFKWKDKKEGDSLHMGVIAQEVEKVFPDVVSAPDNGNKSVNYNELVGALVEAAKTLKQGNDAMRKRNAELGRRISALEARYR